MGYGTGPRINFEPLLDPMTISATVTVLLFAGFSVISSVWRGPVSLARPCEDSDAWSRCRFRVGWLVIFLNSGIMFADRLFIK